MSKKTGKHSVSRREFLVRTAAGTGAAALVGFGASEARAMGAIPAQWDQEADVVILGFGGAGACAAIEAHDAGAKVLVLEKQPKQPITRTRGWRAGSSIVPIRPETRPP